MTAGPPGAPPPPQPPPDPPAGAGAAYGQAGQPGRQGQSGPARPYPHPGGYSAAQARPGQSAYPMPSYDTPQNAGGPQVAGAHATASGHAAVAGAFEPPQGSTWTRVSSRLIWYRRVQVLLAALLLMAVGAFLATRELGPTAGIVVLVAVLVGALVAWLLAELNYRSWGYVEHADEFLMTHGVIVRRFLMVPYGRMQLVDVNSNLFQQWFGIATVRLYTAAATTEARLPGIPRDEADRLRDRLVAKGEARSMGL